MKLEQARRCIYRAACAIFFAAAAVSSTAIAQQYPSKPVTVYVGYPPGGSTDLSTRIVADKLGRALGQAFVVVNKPGAAGNIALAQVAKAPPDGYTLVHGYVGTMSINPSLYGPKLPYDPVKDFVAIAPVASVPMFLVVPPSLGVRTLKDFVALAKSKPGTLTFGTAGSGSTQQLGAEMFKASAGIDARAIPFGGSGPANIALLGGIIDFMFDAGQVMQQAKAGNVVALATTAGKRLSNLPDLPTVAETYPGFEATSWHGLFAPAGTPKAVVDLLNAKLVEILAEPDTQQKLAEAQMTPVSMSPAAFAQFVHAETIKWSKVVKSAGITLD